jgi:methylmalonyl-CoA epimerase
MSGYVKRVEHLGIAVRDPRERLKLWANTLGLELEKVEAVESEGVRTWFLGAGNTHLELLEPLDESSPIAKALDKRGEGIHHLSLEVDDIERVLARLAQAGIEPIGEAPRSGAGGTLVAFLHPKQTGGVLLELTQRLRAEPREQHGPGGIPRGELVVLYLQEPKARMIGLLEHLDAAGVVLEGFDLEGWDDLLAQHARGEGGPVGPSRQYFPIARVEKILVDRDTGDLPSLARQFETRASVSLKEVLRGSQGRAHEEAD